MANQDQKQIQTQTQKTASKKASVKPVQSAATKKPTATRTQGKGQTQQAAHVFKIAAGVTVKLDRKELNKALSYHCKAGNIEKTDKGLKLTDKGAKNFEARRQAEPQLFQEVAAFVHGKGAIPKVWGGQKTTTKVSETLTLPNMLYWGSFATKEMRLAFAALWAK